MYTNFILSAWQQCQQHNVAERCALCLRSGASVGDPRGECWRGQSVPGQLPPGIQRHPGFCPEDHSAVPPTRSVWILLLFALSTVVKQEFKHIYSKCEFFEFSVKSLFPQPMLQQTPALFLARKRTCSKNLCGSARVHLAEEDALPLAGIRQTAVGQYLTVGGW